MPRISENQVALYIKFDGDADAIEYSGTTAEKAGIKPSIWTELMQFQQRLVLHRHGMLGKQATAELESDVEERFCDMQASTLLRNFVEKVRQRNQVNK